MDETKPIEDDNSSSEESAFGKKEIIVESLSETVIQDVSTVLEIEDHGKEHGEANLGFSSINRKRKNMEDDTASSTNPPKSQKVMKCKKPKFPKFSATLLRRNVLVALTKKKLFLITDERSPHKSGEPQINFPDLQQKSRIAEKRKIETKVTDSSIPNLYQMQSTSNINQPSRTARSKSVVPISVVTATKSPELQYKKSRISEGKKGTKATDSTIPNVFQMLGSSNVNQPSPTAKSRTTSTQPISFVTTTKSKDSKYKKSRISDEGRKETMATSSSFPNVFRMQRTSNVNQPSSPTKSTSARTISNVTPTTSQHAVKVKTREDVRKHLKRFLQTNKESLDRTVTSGDRGKIEISDSSTRSLTANRETARESTSQSLGESVKTTTHEMQESLKGGISAIDHAIAIVLKYIEKSQLDLSMNILRYEELLLRKKVDTIQEKNVQERNQFLLNAKEIQKELRKCYDVLCDHEKHFDKMKQDSLKTSPSKNDLSNIRSLMDLPLSATNILTFFSLFLYEYKSLYSEIPIENIFKRINTDNFEFAYRRYKEQRVVQKGEREMSKNAVTKFLNSYNDFSEECISKFKEEIPHSQSSSFEDYQNYVNSLKKAVRENLTCLYKLISAGSFFPFRVEKFLSESRKTTILVFLLLDKRRSDVFP